MRAAVGDGSIATVHKNSKMFKIQFIYLQVSEIFALLSGYKGVGRIKYTGMSLSCQYGVTVVLPTSGHKSLNCYSHDRPL